MFQNSSLSKLIWITEAFGKDLIDFIILDFHYGNIYLQQFSRVFSLCLNSFGVKVKLSFCLKPYFIMVQAIEWIYEGVENIVRKEKLCLSALSASPKCFQRTFSQWLYKHRLVWYKEKH